MALPGRAFEGVKTAIASLSELRGARNWHFLAVEPICCKKRDLRSERIRLRREKESRRLPFSLPANAGKLFEAVFLMLLIRTGTRLDWKGSAFDAALQKNTSS
ncbi:hypothetical protein [Rhizobium herbae]|uniref:Uncharacterized protein n=1 Tax=Rhizobium herbae TaxID=508661 RepID=A0ABS4EL04_9HYPH|nr:hypothetical protein [Rhizobium herbae]MBP1858588.1 hypothetical protein [Rhizobium herbae]